MTSHTCAQPYYLDCLQSALSLKIRLVLMSSSSAIANPRFSRLCRSRAQVSLAVTLQRKIRDCSRLLLPERWHNSSNITDSCFGIYPHVDFFWLRHVSYSCLLNMDFKKNPLFIYRERVFRLNNKHVLAVYLDLFEPHANFNSSLPCLQVSTWKDYEEWKATKFPRF